MEPTDNQQLPGPQYGAEPPPLPPPQAAMRQAPVLRQRRVAAREPVALWLRVRLAVAIVVWIVAAGAAVTLGLARPHSIEGVIAQIMRLICVPVMWVALLAGVCALLYSFVRQGVSVLTHVNFLLLLAGMVLLAYLYPKVQAIKQLPIF